jgi:hypothetical protein
MHGRALRKASGRGLICSELAGSVAVSAHSLSLALREVWDSENRIAAGGGLGSTVWDQFRGAEGSQKKTRRELRKEANMGLGKMECRDKIRFDTFNNENP